MTKHGKTKEGATTIAQRFARRKWQRGLSNATIMFEVASILGFGAVVGASWKRVHSGITSMRAVENSAQDSASVSAGSCQNLPIQAALGDVAPRATVNLGNVDLLSASPLVPPLLPPGITHPEAFHSQLTALRDTSSRSVNVRQQPMDGPDGTVTEAIHMATAQRKQNCPDLPPMTPTVDLPVKSLSMKLWGVNLAAYP
jgi:hypothetical protein